MQVVATIVAILFLAIAVFLSYRRSRWDALESVAMERISAFQDYESAHSGVSIENDPEAQRLLREALLANAELYKYRSEPPGHEFSSYMAVLVRRVADREFVAQNRGKFAVFLR